MNTTTALTLGQLEVIRGRELTQFNEDGRTKFCVNCLKDLPADAWQHWSHRCEDDAEPEVPLPVEHKTRTFDPRPETGRFTKRGRRLRDRWACGICSCGWSQWEANRELARKLARAHREAAS